MGKGNSRGGAAGSATGAAPAGDGVSHSERDELLTGDAPPRRRRKRGRRLKRAALTLLVLVVLLGAGVWFAGPALAERYAPGIIADQSRKQIRGALEIDSLDLSWTKSQQAHAVRLLDPAGDVVATLNASTDRGLIGLAADRSNLGTIDLDGSIDIVAYDDGTTNLSRAIEPRDKQPGASSSPNGSPGGAGQSSTSPLGDLIGRANLKGVNVSYRKTPDADPLLVTIDGVATLDQGDVAVDVTGVSNLPDAEPIRLTLTGTDVFDALGRLQLADAQVDGALAMALGPEGLAELMRRLQPARDWEAAASSAPVSTGADDALRADVKFQIKDGVLTVPPENPAFIRARLAPALLGAYTGQSGLSIANEPVATIAISRLDIPLPDAAAGAASPDMRGASIKGSLEISETRAELDVAGQRESLVIEPVKATFGTDDLSQGLGLMASTSWQREGRPAGDVSADIRVTGVLDERDGRWIAWTRRADGAIREPEDLRAQIVANDLPSAILQALIKNPRIVLSELVGPTTDTTLTLSMEPGASASADSGRGVIIALTTSGRHARVEADAMWQGDRIAALGDGVRAEFDHVAPSIRAFAGDDAQITGDGTVRLLMPEFQLPLTSGKRGIDWALASAEADLHIGNMSVAVQGQGEPIQINDLHTSVTLARGGAARLDVDYQMTHEGREFGPKGAITAKNLFSDNPASPGINLRQAEISGQISTGDMPTSLAALFLDEQQTLAAQEALGPSAALVVRPTGASVVGVGQLALIEFEAATGTKITAPISRSQAALSVGPTEGSVVVTPGLYAQLDKMFDISTRAHDALNTDPARRTPIRLDSVFVARLNAQPLNIALDDQGMPVYETDPVDGGRSLKLIGTRQASLSVPNAIGISGLPNPVKSPDGAPGAPIALQVRGLEAAYSTHPNSPRDNETSIKASIFDPADTTSPVAQLDAVVRGNEVPLEARLINASAPGLERLIGRPGMIDGALGSPISLTAIVEEPRERGQTLATLQIDAPRLTTGTITLAQSGDKQRTDLVRPVEMTWSPTRAWFDQYALKGADQDWRVRLVGDFTLPLAIERLALGAPGRLLDPGVFALTARAQVPSLTLATRDGQQETIENLKAAVATTDTPGALTLRLTADDAQQTQILSADLRVDNLLTPEGGVDTASARASGGVKGEIPTLLVDTLLVKNGLLVDTLGPTSTADITLTGLALDASQGSLAGVLRSNYASVELSGDVRDSTLSVNGTPRAEMSRITEAASRRLFAVAFPFLNSFEKTPQDRPAVATATGLTIPLDGDMRKLNGAIHIDLGTVKFKTAPALAPLLKAIKARPAGEVGDKVPPFVATITNGVIRYDEVDLPIGDVTMRTYGKVNLVRRKIEVILMVPFASVSDDLAATVGRLPFVGDIAVVPIKVVGDLDQPRVEFDPELLIKNTLEKNPISSILEQIGGSRNDDKENNRK